MADGAVIIKVDADDKQAEKKLDKLNAKILKLEEQLRKTGAERAPIAEQLREAKNEAVAAFNEVERLEAALAKSQERTAVKYSGTITPAQFMEELDNQQQISAELERQKGILAQNEAVAQKLLAQDEKLVQKLEQQTAELNASKEAAGAIQRQLIEASSNSLAGLKGGAESITAGFNKSLKTMLKYGLGIRSLYVLFNKLRSALVEGFKNLVQYDGQTNKSISQIRSALGGLKNNLATAFAPILNVVAPILTRFINLLSTAASYVAMFFAVLGGQSSYKRAVAVQEDYAASLGGTAEAAGAAGSAVKDMERQMSGLDEMNTWQSKDSSGGGGGGGAGGGSASEPLFEDVEIENADALKERFKDILWYVGEIAAALLTWKIAKAFGADLKTTVGLIMAVVGALEFAKGYIDAWQSGIDLKNMKEMFIGLAVAVSGVAVAVASITKAVKLAGGATAVEAAAAGASAGIVAAAITALVGGIALIVLGIKEWIETGELGHETCLVLASGILIVGAALSVLTMNFIPLIIAAVIWLVLTVISYWDEIKAWTEKAWTAIKDFFVNLWNSIKTIAVNVFTAVKNFFVNTWTNIKTSVTEKVEALKNGVKEKFTAMKENIQTTIENAKQSVTDKFDAIKTNITDKVKNAKETVLGLFTDIKDGIKEKIETARDKVSTAIDKIKGFLKFQWSLPTLKTPHLSWSTTPASGWVSNILSALGLPTSLPKLSVSWYARGGIVDGASLIGAGEAGKEAIIPLERHTEWIDIVAERIAGILAKVRQSASYDAAVADKLDGVSAAIYALADKLQTLPMPVMATGTVAPPRALADDSEMREFLSELKGIFSGGKDQRTGTTTQNFIAQVNGKTLFQVVIREGKLQQSRTGYNPFDL